MGESASFVLNDQPRPWRAALTIHDLLFELDPKMPIAVVKIAGQHVPRRTWKQRQIMEGEEVRVVYIIAGG